MAASLALPLAASAAGALLQRPGRLSRGRPATGPSATQGAFTRKAAIFGAARQRTAIPERFAAPLARAAIEAEEAAVAPGHPITLTDAALDHILKLREESGGDGFCLRIGVKQGGCSGMSYHMDFEKEENISESEDMVMDHAEHNFKLVCDTKSLLYLFGMNLDYSHELIGGGFQFHNPNAESSCGCGKSFGA